MIEQKEQTVKPLVLLSVLEETAIEKKMIEAKKK